MAPARRSARGSRNSRRSAPASRSGRTSARAQSGSSRRASRDDDDPRSSSRRSARGSARGGSSNDNTLIIAGVVGAVVVLGGGIFLFSGGKKPAPRREEERAPPPKAASAPNWYSIGRNDGASWARHVGGRGSMAGGDGDPFAKDEVLRIADMKTSDHYKKGLKTDIAGQKRYIEGFCAGVKAVVGR